MSPSYPKDSGDLKSLEYIYIYIYIYTYIYKYIDRERDREMYRDIVSHVTTAAQFPSSKNYQDVPRKQHEEDQLRREQEVPCVYAACGPGVYVYIYICTYMI